jgi:hypothetical protein
MARKHNMDEVLSSLRKKNDVRIEGSQIKILSNQVFTPSGELIPNPNKKHDLGNGSHGKIDFLIKYCGFRKITVEKF